MCLCAATSAPIHITRHARSGQAENSGKAPYERNGIEEKNASGSKLVTTAAVSEMSSHNDMTGKRMITKPLSKPAQWACRLTKERPRTDWHDAQRSKSQLKA